MIAQQHFCVITDATGGSLGTFRGVLEFFKPDSCGLFCKSIIEYNKHQCIHEIPWQKRVKGRPILAGLCNTYENALTYPYELSSISCQTAQSTKYLRNAGQCTEPKRGFQTVFQFSFLPRRINKPKRGFQCINSQKIVHINRHVCYR